MPGIAWVFIALWGAATGSALLGPPKAWAPKDPTARSKGVGKREKPHPWVNIRPGQHDYSCAWPADLDHPGPHIHAAFFFDLLGDRIAPGDTLAVTINAGAESAQSVVYESLDGVTATLTYPAGVGDHTIDVAWLDVTGEPMNYSSASLKVYPCPAARAAE